MIILACDHCAKQSPDAEGHRIADAWVTLTVQRQSQRDEKTGKRYILCEDCLPLLGTKFKVSL